MHRLLASPNWPVEWRRGGGRWRRFGLPQFLVFSVLVHGLALLVNPDFRPFSPVDRSTSKISAELRAVRPIPDSPAELAPKRAPQYSRPSSVARNVSKLPAVSHPAPTPPPDSIHLTQHPPLKPVDTGDLLERSKAELNAAGRRQMLDPMFAPSARHAPPPTPLERATTSVVSETKIEQRGPDLLRVTHADGRRYCLQRLPEVATRDIPGQVLAVPMHCQ